MQKANIKIGTLLQWNYILLLSVIFAVFILPLIPVKLHAITFRIVYSLIYISAVFSLERRGKWILTLFFITFFTDLITNILDYKYLNDFSRSLNVIFFLVIIVRLIFQTASASDVNVRIILGSITGYLLLGLIFSIFVSVIISNDPGAYSNLTMTDDNRLLDKSLPLYYTFVTIASLGYGDISPLTPVARSLATFIAVSGQLYIATIIALLVGKFSSKQSTK